MQDFRTSANPENVNCEIGKVSTKKCSRVARFVRDTGKVQIHLCTRHDSADGQKIGKHV